MLRRFEIYSVREDIPAEVRDRFAASLRDCARWIPEVLHSAIGWTSASPPLNFVWEHGYASPAAYRRYMEHPYHAAVLDRYLMADSAERITFANGIGVGLIGYPCDTPEYFLGGGARRVVALKLASGAERDFAAMAAAECGRGAMALSVFKENAFGPRWADGETWIGPPPAFPHLWEQGFASIEAAHEYGQRWRDAAGALVERSVEVVYAVEPGYGYADDRQGRRAT